MKRITVYSTPVCARCKVVKKWLDSRGIPYTVVDLSESPADTAAMKELGYTEAPIIVVSTGDPETDIHWSGFVPGNLERYCGELRGMKALTVRQPWAWAIIHGGKDVENRSRPTKYRRQLYIHAGLGYSADAEEDQAMQEAWINAAQKLPAERGNMGPLRKQDLFLDYGTVLGTVEVVGCHHANDCDADTELAACSDWAQPDAWHWELANPRPLACPFPEKGKLGIWNLLPHAVTA